MAAAGGATLHQLRHSALTHLGQAGVSLPLFSAKARHRSWRITQPLPADHEGDVAKLTAEHAPTAADSDPEG